MALITEKYKGRLAVAEKYYTQTTGEKMDQNKKLVTAMCLDNVARYINEAFETTVGTQRADMNAYKIFCMDISTLTVPNLVIHDLFMVKPMASFSGSLIYMKYGLDSEKGGVGGRDANGDFNTVINSPFMYGATTRERANYTGDRVVEAVTAGTGAQALAWLYNGNLVQNVFENNGTKYDIKLVKAGAADIYGYYNASDKKFYSNVSGTTYTNQIDVASDTKVAYVYNNVTVPQTKLPTLSGRMDRISLEARARRIGVRYSQIAAYEAKNDYGIDFESTIAQQAQAELEYEIDSEAAFLIQDTGDAECTNEATGLVTWCDEEVDTISYSMKAEGFARAIEKAKMAVYKKTGRFTPTWMLVAPEIMPILTFVPGFKAANVNSINGPYLAGDIAGLKVIVSPALQGATKPACYLGVLGKDGKTATGVYAPLTIYAIAA